MSYKKVCEIQPRLEIHQNFKNLAPYEQVKPAHSLIENDHFGFRCQCPGDGYTLALPTTQLVRVPAGNVRRQSHQRKEFLHPQQLITSASAETMNSEWLFEYRTNLEAWIKTRRRILKHHL